MSFLFTSIVAGAAIFIYGDKELTRRAERKKHLPEIPYKEQPKLLSHFLNQSQKVLKGDKPELPFNLPNNFNTNVATDPSDAQYQENYAHLIRLMTIPLYTDLDRNSTEYQNFKYIREFFMEDSFSMRYLAMNIENSRYYGTFVPMSKGEHDEFTNSLCMKYLVDTSTEPPTPFMMNTPCKLSLAYADDVLKTSVNLLNTALSKSYTSGGYRITDKEVLYVLFESIRVLKDCIEAYKGA